MQGLYITHIDMDVCQLLAMYYHYHAHQSLMIIVVAISWGWEWTGCRFLLHVTHICKENCFLLSGCISH